MSVVVDRQQTFLGLPLLKVRDVLRAWRYGGSKCAADIAKLKKISLDARTVMTLLEELRDRSLIGREEGHCRIMDGLTESGLALATAIGRKRTPKEKAWQILRTFLNRCDDFNKIDRLPIRVSEIWLFGSMLDDTKSDVGDIDLVVVTERTTQSGRKWRVECEKIATELGGVRGNRGWNPYWGEEYIITKLLHGGKRHPALSIIELDQLKRLACPCRLIFDVRRRGQVDDMLSERILSQQDGKMMSALPAGFPT